MCRRHLLALVVVIAAAAACSNNETSSPPQTTKESAYERVLRTGTLRAGYVNYPPSLILDPNTKAISGIFHDVLQEVGKSLQLKVEYVEEVGWATMLQGLENGRYDITGQGTWANPTRGKLATLSRPVYYSGIGVWVRPNEARIKPDNDWASLNQESIRLGAIDGSTPALIAKTQFPKARLVSYPDLTSESQIFLDVVAGRVDAFFAEPSVGLGFLKNNPGKLKNVAEINPIRVFANVFVMPKGDQQFKMMIDTAVEALENSGTVEQILKKYEPGPHAFYRVAPQFATR